MDDFEYELALDEISLENMLNDVDALDDMEDAWLDKHKEDESFSLEAMKIDKMIQNLQQARNKFYPSFIKQSKKVAAKRTLWLRNIEAEQASTLSFLKEAKSVDAKVLGELVANKMKGKFPNIISLINGVDPKQIRLAKDRFINLIPRIKENRNFMRQMKIYADKEFGFNNLMDGKLQPNDVVDFLSDQYKSETNLYKSLLSIKFFGVQRRFRTDKRKLLVDFVTQPGAKTVLLDWSGQQLKYLTLQAEKEIRVTYKTLKLTNTSYDDFYHRFGGYITKILSDNSAVDILVSDMNTAIDIYEKISTSLWKLYADKTKTYDELKYIRRFHLMLVRVISLKIDELMTTYRMVSTVANIVVREMK